MNIKQLATEMSKEPGMPNRTELTKILHTLTRVIARLVLKGHIVSLRNLCSIKIDIVKERTFNNLNVPGGKVIKPKGFKLVITGSQTLKKKVNAKKAY